MAIKLIFVCSSLVLQVVPMLNPDGVVVGNYRCSLAGRDLNRNYRTLLRDSFPSVWHTRNMVEKWDLIKKKMLNAKKKKSFLTCLELLNQAQDISPLKCLRLSNMFQIWWLPNSLCIHNFLIDCECWLNLFLNRNLCHTAFSSDYWPKEM